MSASVSRVAAKCKTGNSRAASGRWTRALRDAEIDCQYSGAANRHDALRRGAAACQCCDSTDRARSQLQLRRRGRNFRSLRWQRQPPILSPKARPFWPPLPIEIGRGDWLMKPQTQRAYVLGDDDHDRNGLAVGGPWIKPLTFIRGYRRMPTPCPTACCGARSLASPPD